MIAALRLRNCAGRIFRNSKTLTYCINSRSGITSRSSSSEPIIMAAPLLDDSSSAIVDSVKDYYGKRVQKTSDLQTNVCTVGSGGGMTKKAKAAYKLLHQEVVEKYYGCGVVVPEAIEGRHVLDLGCGAGVDIFVLSAVVGAEGRVTGVDMTEEQLQVARRHRQFHADAFGHKQSNVEILQGNIEDLQIAGVAPNSVDVIVSNCVVNLASDKLKVLREAFHVLKDGGEFHFSDIYADQEVPESLRRDAVLWGECLSGALYWRHLHALARDVGFAAPRLVRANAFDVSNPQIEEQLRGGGGGGGSGIRFVSATYRMFKLPAAADETAPYQVIYSGEIEEHEESWSLDHRRTFPSGFVVGVDAETASILMASRFKDEFEFNKMPTTTKTTKNGCGEVAAEGEDDDPFQLAAGGNDAGCCPPASTKGTCC